MFIDSFGRGQDNNPRIHAFDCGGKRSTWRRPTQTQGEHVNPKTNWTVVSSGHLDDTKQATWRQVMFFFRCFCLCLSTLLPWVSIVLALGGIRSVRETSEQLRELEKVTLVSIDIMVSEQWVKFQFRVNILLHGFT